MAKDGTIRGGMRVGAGQKRKPQDGKIIEKTAEFVANSKISPPKKYLTAKQKDGGKLCAKKIYEEITQWIIAHGCETLIPKQLVEDYAQATARHIQCEYMLSEFGLIAKHPTTGEPIPSPFHRMNIENQKLASQLWYQIFSAVRDNAPQGLIVGNPQDQMEKLLMFREAAR